MISGVHVIIYSANAEADRAFFRDILDFRAVDAGHGWLIFASPPAEIALHPAEQNDKHEIYLMSTDLAGTIQALEKHNVPCETITDQGWGLM
jgi:catechol 2,3-dioxygenase-like lactoylglutathione lyase family enzyme